jgi:hypothetical protein
MSRLTALFAITTIACASAHAPSAAAFSTGSVVCEVNQLPFAPMASVVSPVPTPQWRLEVQNNSWNRGQVVTLRLVHDDPARRARGVLLWVKGSKFGTPVGAGSFEDTVASSLWQFVSAMPPENCGQWAVTHESAEPKSQSFMVFTWRPPAENLGIMVARAFVVEDCAPGPGGCRGAQALTPFLVLPETLLSDGFE